MMMGHMHRANSRLQYAAAWIAFASLLAGSLPTNLVAQQAPATEIALPLPEDRGAAALSQSLKRLGTWASVMAIVAHPDDEDGAMLTYESRGQGVRASLLTLTRGEGGQNAMSADSYDALGVIRTNELLKAGEFYGVKQYWGTEADFGFSKTQEESFARWGHERVLYDAVLAIRRERPLVLTATFIGGVTDGHGQHQVSGEIAQEAFLAAGDPKVFPEQIAAGLRPWSPRKVYALVPFAPITDKGMFDYATGKWAPARFYNYVTKEWSTTAPTANVSIPEGQLDPVLGRSYVQISRQGWGEQKSQNGGANPALSGNDSSDYHCYGSRVEPAKASEESFFDGIPTGIEGMASLVSGAAPGWLTTGLAGIASDVAKAQKNYIPTQPEGIAPALKAGYLATKSLRDRVAVSQLKDGDKADLVGELDIKMAQFQTALAEALGLDLQAFTVRGGSGGQGGRFGPGVDETPRSVTPGQAIQVKIHTGHASEKTTLSHVWLESADGKPWAKEDKSSEADQAVAATVPVDAAPTEPYFSRPGIAQPYYDVSNPALRGLSFAPYPLAAWAEFTYDGLSIRMGEVVQAMQRGMGREIGRGGYFEPLVVTPPVGVRVEPDARILPLDGSPLPVRVTVHTEAAADGRVQLTLPAGWIATPAEAPFHRASGGDTEPIVFLVTASAASSKTGEEFRLTAQAEVNGHSYRNGWQTVGYPGLRPYNMYRNADFKTRSIDVKVAAGLRVGYVMGTGDTVPEAIEGLGIAPHTLTAAELASADLSAWDVILIGIRAYSVRPELAAVQSRLNDYVRAGGTLIVQYQSGNFPAPSPLSMGRTPERVVEEAAPVKILAPENPLLAWPNQITAHDFDGWVEERGHSFLDSWDAAYTPLTETGDAGQDAQRGGLLVTHSGKGTYVYMSYALYRQLPELVPGSYRLLANLLSAGKK
jgi:LmbE family N-acetylglucosaminyl deacetylase